MNLNDDSNRKRKQNDRDSSVNSESKNSRHSSDMNVGVPIEKYKNSIDCRGTIIWIIRRWKSRQNNSSKFKRNEGDSDVPDCNSKHSDEGDHCNWEIEDAEEYEEEKRQKVTRREKDEYQANTRSKMISAKLLNKLQGRSQHKRFD